MPDATIGRVSTPATPIPLDVSVATTPRRTWWRSGWPPLLASLACAGAYAVFIALPFYVNGLDAYPLEDLATGRHDPLGLWPYTRGAAWESFRVAGMATFLLGPAAAIAAGAWAVVRTHQGIAAGDLLRTAPALVAAAVAAGTVAWLFSPSGSALTGWFLG
jgi:hypothetical protein